VGQVQVHNETSGGGVPPGRQPRLRGGAAGTATAQGV